MARLQRKKTSGAKKKAAERKSEAANVAPNGGGTKAAIATGSVKPMGKRTAVVSKKAPPATGKESQNLFNKAAQFLREVKVELKKVTWPSRKQTIGSTAVVLVIVLLISLFLGLVDIGLSNIIRLILQ